MKIDLKKSLLYFVFVCLLASLAINFIGWDKEALQKLEEKNILLEKTRDSLNIVNQDLKKDFDARQDSIEKRNLAIIGLKAQIAASKKEAKSYKDRADRDAKDLEETKKMVDFLRRNPIKRDDKELIDSFKNKLKMP
jgi:Flp pilus assembly protein TadB